MIFTTLAGIVVAACVFAALLWSVYRAVVTQGWLRLTYSILVVSTLLVISAITWNFATLTLTAGLTCTAAAAVAVAKEQRWSKLLPLVQVILGGLSVWAGGSIVF